ncbi:MAG: 50S ribosomal protein L13 [Bacillota bacterium]
MAGVSFICKEVNNLGTYMAKTADIQRSWYILDATGKSLGRLATEAARLLRGKHKPIFTPHVDTGDFVIIINADKAVLTGNKLAQKKYYRHSGYPGGLTEISYKELMKKRPVFAVEKAVKGMMPHNSLGREAGKKLKVYSGENHPHQAQKPEVWQF